MIPVRDDLSQVLVVVLGMAAAVFLGNVLVRAAIDSLEQGANDVVGMEGYPGAGTLIGVLERVVVYASVIGGAPQGAALVIALKTAARFGQAHDNPYFAERFIVGTITSVGVAAGAAVVARWAIGWQPWPS